MTQSPLLADESPRPSAAEIQRRLASELSLGRRLVYVALLLVDLAVGVAIASLLLTEPALPTRTQVAFAAMLVVAAAWAIFFAWTLRRRHVLLAHHRLVASRLATAFTAAFTAGALLLAATAPDQHATALLAAAMGATLTAVAVVLLWRARRGHAALLARKSALERELNMVR